MVVRLSALANISDFLYLKPLQVGFKTMPQSSQDYFLREINPDLKATIKTILQITPKDVVTTLRAFKQGFMGPATMIETIASSPFLNAVQKQTVIRHIVDTLSKKARIVGASVKLLKSDLQRELAKIPNSIEVDRISLLIEKLLVSIEARDAIEKTYRKKLSVFGINPDELKQMSIARRASAINVACIKPSKTPVQELRDSICYYYSRMHGTSRYLKDFLGNGVIGDAKSIQEGGACWAAAGVNALVQMERGRELLRNLIMKKNGITTIYLPEARKAYSFTENEILNHILGDKRSNKYACRFHSTSTVLGDGDTTAFMMAVTKYLKNLAAFSHKSDFMDGNHSTRIFKLVSSHLGLQATHIQRNALTAAEYGRFVKEFNGKNVAAILSVPEGESKFMASYRIAPQLRWRDYVLSNKHALSVVGIDNNFIYLGDSNYPDRVIKLAKKECIDRGLHMITIQL